MLSLRLEAPVGTACTSSNGLYQGLCGEFSDCRDALIDGCLFTSGNCWQEPYGSGTGSGSSTPSSYGCCVSVNGKDFFKARFSLFSCLVGKGIE